MKKGRWDYWPITSYTDIFKPFVFQLVYPNHPCAFSEVAVHSWIQGQNSLMANCRFDYPLYWVFHMPQNSWPQIYLASLITFAEVATVLLSLQIYIFIVQERMRQKIILKTCNGLLLQSLEEISLAYIVVLHNYEHNALGELK